MQITYLLDNKSIEIDVPDETRFSAGKPELLSQKYSDLSLGCNWYEQGYSTPSYTSRIDFSTLVKEVTDVVRERLRGLFPNRELDNFELSKYHEFVSADEHRNVADKVMKRLYCNDLNIASNAFVELISEHLEHPVGFKRIDSDFEHWIIVRINPPYSLAYNPVHKDIYEDYDETSTCPRMINAWVPLAGVNEHAGLGVAPKSHRICESRILRTRAGSCINGRKFSVNSIQSWDNSVSLNTIAPPPGKMLIFSSHLIHGLGINANQDTTRVALEFRLHSQES